MQRRGQVQREAGHGAADLHLRLAVLHGVAHAELGLPAGARQQRPGRGQHAFRLQAAGGGVARGVNHRAAGATGHGLGATRQADWAAHGLRAGLVQRETLLGEANAALRLLQQRHVLAQLDVVAPQAHFAFHAALVHAGNRQVQAQFQADFVVGLHAVQRAVQPGGHGRCAHKAQAVFGRAFAAGLHAHFGVRQVGNVGVDVRELQAWKAARAATGLAHAHAVALELQAAGQVFQHRPVGLVGVLQVARHVAQLHLLHRRNDAEGALLAIGKGEVVQVALDGHGHLPRLTSQHRLFHVVTRLVAHAQRQVAVHAGAVGAAQLPGQLQGAWEARFALGQLGLRLGLPTGLELALCIGVAQLQLFDLHADVGTCNRPAHIGRQALDRNLRLFKHTGKAQTAAGHAQVGLAAGFFQVKVHIGGAHARRAGVAVFAGAGRHQQLAHLALGAVVQLPIGAARPIRRQLVHAAAHRVGAQRIAQGIVQRQAHQHLAQRGQVDLLGRQLGAGLAFVRRVAGDAHLRALPALAVSGGKLQVAPLQRKAFGPGFPNHAASHVAQVQRAQVFGKARLNAVDRHIGRGALPLAVFHIQPHAQRAAGGLQVHTRADVLAQRGHVQLRELGIHGARQVRQGDLGPPQRRAQIRLPRKALAPLGGRRGRQAQAVLVVVVAQRQVQRLQRERRGASQRVAQVHLAALNQHMALLQEPVPGVTASVSCLLAGYFKTGHHNAAVLAALDLQLGHIEAQLVERQLPGRQRRHGHARLRQIQRDFARGRQQAHATELELWPPAVGAGRDVADFDRGAQALRGPARDVGSPLVDSRHNPNVQQHPGQHRDEQQHPKPTRSPTQQSREPAQIRRGNDCRHG